MAKRKKAPKVLEDFSFSGLPSSRRKQFFDCLRNRWALFLEVGAIFAFFSLLLAGLIYAQDLVFHSISNNASLTEADRNNQLSSMSLTFASLFGFLIAIFLLPLGGILRVYRSLIFDEGVFFLSDYRKGFRETWKLTLLLGLLLGGGYFACSFYKSIISVEFLSYAPYGILLFLILPWAFTTLSYGSIYSSSFMVTLQNGFVLTAKSFFNALCFSFLLVLPLFFLFIPSTVFRYIALVLCFLLYYPTVLFAFYLMDIACFDEMINAHLNNGLYHKGLCDGQWNYDE